MSTNGSFLRPGRGGNLGVIYFPITYNKLRNRKCEILRYVLAKTISGFPNALAAFCRNKNIYPKMHFDTLNWRLQISTNQNSEVERCR